MKIWHVLVAAAVAYTPMIASAANVEFVNQSSWAIHEIYFSSTGQRSWGEDYLDDEVLKKGESLTLSGVEAGKWDVMIVDEDGDKCVLEGVAISGSDSWSISDDDLLACQAAS